MGKAKAEPGTSLIALNSQYQGIAVRLTELGGELTPETEAELDRVTSALIQKVDGYGFVQEQLEASAEFWKFQKEKCAHAQRVFENAITGLKARMKLVLAQHPDQALQGELYRFFLCDAKANVAIDENLLPAKFKKTRLEITPDKEKIDEALAAGETIPGVTVTPNKSLRSGRPK